MARGRIYAPAETAREAAGHTVTGVVTCRHCGLVMETLALRCPRCLEPLPLGCDGNCRECGKDC